MERFYLDKNKLNFYSNNTEEVGVIISNFDDF